MVKDWMTSLVTECNHEVESPREFLKLMNRSIFAYLEVQGRKYLFFCIASLTKITVIALYEHSSSREYSPLGECCFRLCSKDKNKNN